MAVPDWATGQVLTEMRAEELPAPETGIPVFVDYPDKAAVIITSVIPNLTFESNMGGIVAERSTLGSGRYVLILEPFTQILVIKAPGHIETRWRVSNPQPREVRYLTIKPLTQLLEVPVTFRTTPEDAIIIIDGDTLVDHSAPTLLSVGEKSIQIFREGFISREDEIVVSPDRILFEYILQRRSPTAINLQTTPGGVSVFLDGIEIGRTDGRGQFKFYRFSGVYSLDLMRSGFRSIQQNIRVEDSADEKYTFTLDKISGTLQLTVSPADAEVRLNKQLYRSTRSIELSEGLYQLEITKDGFKPISEDLQIRVEETLTRNYTLEPLTGNLNISVSPLTAQLTLKNTATGVITTYDGPVELQDLSVGNYQLTISARGYRQQEHTITIEQDKWLIQDYLLEEGDDQACGEPIRDIEGNSYRTVQIGSQCWMAENLNVSSYRNGDPINPPGVSRENLGWTFYNDNEIVFGKFARLYSKNVVMDTRGVCPEGWEIPSVEDFNRLARQLGGVNQAAGKMKKTGDGNWSTPTIVDPNPSGFDAIAAGRQINNNQYEGIGVTAYYWTDTNTSEYNRFNNIIYIKVINSEIMLSSNRVIDGMNASTRCIKNTN